MKVKLLRHNLFANNGLKKKTYYPDQGRPLERGQFEMIR